MNWYSCPLLWSINIFVLKLVYKIIQRIDKSEEKQASI